MNHKQMWNAAKIATYESDLVKFIRSACGEQGRADRAALITLTTLARKADYRTVNLAKNFVKMVLKGYKMNEAAATGTCSWELPLIGINNMLCGAQWDLLDGPQDLAILDYMQAQWKAIARAVRRDLPILRSSEPHSDHARKTVITTLAMIGITKSNIIRCALYRHQSPRLSSQNFTMQRSAVRCENFGPIPYLLGSHVSVGSPRHKRHHHRALF